ncbi:sensor histidine kinase [Dyadobacter psychrotolerans]|uniref:histidine kinase n=1 Tax=Dyadobacter psychrotolerans TaxID=2541721 RepID=A0A4R5DUI4_9BACT|nr:HAMP domain-containing sensor histidine kinase [Dyadobacter psychrotolerans]TDE14865.1 HAMP domain-containing histidine kinase [Dyadobacter psychrotolerans]
MAKNKTSQQSPNYDLVAFLNIRREAVLNKWRVVCSQDTNLNSKASFSREEFNDQIPVLLDILNQKLLGEKISVDPILVASEHGLHRWQTGYELSELLIELEHLFVILQDEIHAFERNSKITDLESAQFVQQQIFKIYADANRGSLLYYNELRQAGAAEQAANLQNAFNQLEELGKKRNEHLRHSSHDLRSSFSVLMMASEMWEIPASGEERSELAKMMNKNLSSIREMLLQLTDYARIEAGQEILELKQFDAAALINQIIGNTLPLAQTKNLTLQGEGPQHLKVFSDPVQIQRVLQNLLHNALKYTQTGGVYITWATENDSRWILSIQDTGPGFQQNTPAAFFAGQLKPAIGTSGIHPDGKALQLPDSKHADYDGNDAFKESEGLGLFIVKKICELLKATMDVESKPGQGTLVRIRFQVKQEPNKPVQIKPEEN